MFITRTLNRTVKGKRYYTHRLVGSEIVDGRKQRRTLLYLGAQFPIPKQDWPLLCRIVLEIQQGYQPNWYDPPEIVQEAHYIVRRIATRNAQPDEHRNANDAAG